MMTVAGEKIDFETMRPSETALIIGGGVAGMQAALDIADQGYQVVLVEKTPSIGGVMAMLDKTFPTLDCSACILTPRLSEVSRHPNIKLLTYSEVTGITGEAGDFKVKVLKKARKVLEDAREEIVRSRQAVKVRDTGSAGEIHSSGRSE